LFFVFQDLLKAVYKCPFHHDTGYKQGYLSPSGPQTHTLGGAKFKFSWIFLSVK